MADTAFHLAGDSDLLHKMAIPTSTFNWNAPFQDPFYPQTSPDSFDVDYPQKRLRLNSNDKQHFISADSLADGLLSQPLHDGIVLQDPIRKRIGTMPSVTNHPNDSSISGPVVSMQDSLQSFKKADNGTLLPPGDMSFPSNSSHPTPEPALPVEEWAHGDIASLGQVASLDGEYTSRQRSEEYSNAASSPGMKRKRDSAGVQIAIPPNISDDQKLLLELRDEQNLPWKDIALKFQNELGRSDRVPALQMRYKRLKERLRVWTDTDIEALRQAYQYWETKRFEIISEKMLEFGVSEKWPARHCALKWQELTSSTDSRTSNFEGDMAGFNIPSQSASPGPQGAQHDYSSSLARSSSLSSLSQGRPNFSVNPSAVTSDPSSGRHGLDSFSPGKLPAQMSSSTGISSPSVAQPFMANYSIAGGAPHAMSPRQRLHSTSIHSSSGITGGQNPELLTQPLYSGSSYSGLGSAATATPPQHNNISNNPLIGTPPSSHLATIAHQSPSYNQMNQQMMTGFSMADPFEQNRESQYTSQLGSGSQYLSQQQQRQ